jgi:hypothetical protein
MVRPSSVSGFGVTVIIPCKDAGDAICDTFRWFEQMRVPIGVDVDCIAVCSAHESVAPNMVGMERQHVLAQGGSLRIRVILAPPEATNKSAQVNYAVSLVTGQRDDRHYIAVYDYDSRPDPDTIVLLAKLCEPTFPRIVQQPSLYVPSHTCGFAWADAYGQSIWTLVYELPLWRNRWDRLTVFLDYPPELRYVIYTTNTIESLNRGLRKIIKNRGAFPHDEAATKLLYLALRNIQAKWTAPVKDWPSILRYFSIQFLNRMPVYTP